MTEERTVVDATSLRLMLEQQDEKLERQWKEIRKYRATLLDARRNIGLLSATLKMRHDDPVNRDVVNDLLDRIDETLNTTSTPEAR